MGLSRFRKLTTRNELHKFLGCLYINLHSRRAMTFVAELSGLYNFLITAKIQFGIYFYFDINYNVP